MMTYLAEPISPHTSPIRDQPISGRIGQDGAGLEDYTVDDWKRLERFLVYGREDGSYRAVDTAVSLDNAHGVFRCLVSDGPRVVRRIIEIAEAGRATRPDPGLFILALAASDRASRETRAAALAALPRVCRTGAELLHFARYVDDLRGWGRGLRRAVAEWYRQPLEHLVPQVLNSPAHQGWTHRDLLRLAHPKAPSAAHQELFRWIVRGWDALPSAEVPELRPIHGIERARRATDRAEVVALIREYGLRPEVIPKAWLRDSGVWEALLDGLSTTDLLERLAALSRDGIFTTPGSATASVAARLRSGERLRRDAVQPMAVLSAWAAYTQSGTAEGSGWWDLDPSIPSALEAAFHLSLESLESTGKRWLGALDISGSMGSGRVEGMAGLSPRMVAAAMALVTSAEERHTFVAFTAGAEGIGGRWDGGRPGLTRLYIPPSARLREVVRQTERLPMGGTDCSLPIQWALERKMPVDVFAVYTDGETWSGSVPPAEALRQYREQMGIPAKLVVVGLASDGFAIADLNDAGMLDVIGFDPAAARVIADFAAG